MKIDLHCHTKSTKQGDGLGRNVSVEVFREKISNADVKIVAITNSGNNVCTEVLNELKKMLDAKNIQLTICGELTSDINNMVSANSVGKVFFAVENNKVELDKIRYEVELCRNSEIDVVGMMIVS